MASKYYWLDEYFYMLKRGASDDELLSTFFQHEMENLTRPYYDVNTDEAFSSATLKKVLMSHNVPEKDLKLQSHYIFVKLSNISLRLETRSNWKSFSMWFTIPFISKRNMSIMCSPERAYEFLMEANDAVPRINAEFEDLKRELEKKKLKKSINEYRLELDKKAKARAVSVASVEAMAKQKFAFVGDGCIMYDHKVNMSHVFVHFMDGKQQMDITVRYNDFKSAAVVMDKAAQIIKQMEDAGVVVRGVVRMRRVYW